MSKLSKVVSVILTTDGDMESYYTLEGRLIGEFKGGVKPAKNSQQTLTSPKVGSKGGVVKPLSPEEMKRVTRKEGDEELTLENRLKYEKEKNT